jgi:hypothetical protein
LLIDVIVLLRNGLKGAPQWKAIEKKPFDGSVVEERPRSPSLSPTYEGAMSSWRRLRIVSGSSQIIEAKADNGAAID